MSNPNKDNYARIPQDSVKKAVAQMTIPIQGHLDLEGFAYIKITRTGKGECFASDVTSQILQGEEPAGGKMTYREMEQTFWRKPAAVKWGKESA